MKKLITFLVFGVVAICGFAQTFEYEGLNYKVLSEVDKTCEVTQNSGASGDITIPEKVTYEGSEYAVISITYRAFEKCYSLTSITLPETLTYIGYSAFEYCTNLTTITIPEGITSIGDSTFKYCYKLTSINLPESLTSIGSEAFRNCGLTSIILPEKVTYISSYAFCESSSLTSINIPEGVTSIGNYTFYGCWSLDSISLPESITSIGERAFYDCYKLPSIKIPGSLTSIGDEAFKSCSSLVSINIPEGVTSIGKDAFDRCSRLTKVEITNLEAWCKIKFSNYSANPLSCAHHLYLNDREVEDLFIPNSLTSIGEYAFAGGSGITSITFPEGFTSIGNSSFIGCSGLTSINIPEGVTSIGNSSFQDCTGVTSINLPESLASIGNSAFKSCTGLTSITLPENVKSIGDNAFSSCESLASITLPKGLSSIGNEVFKSCFSLAEITLPDSLTSIGYGAFGSSGLTSITFPKSLVSIGTEAFAGCGLTSITLPESLTSMGGAVFRNCPNLTSITFSEGFTSIGEYAFIDCPNLTSITFPESLKSTGIGAFRGCTGLTSITFPEGFTSIEEYAFTGCSSLTSINLPESLTSIGYSAFNASGLTSITFPESLTSIQSSAFTECLDLETITFKSKDNLKIGSYSFGYSPNINTVYCLTDVPPTSDSSDVFDSFVYSNATLYVPGTVISLYENTTPWSYFNNIEGNDDRVFTDGDYNYVILDNTAQTVALRRYLGSAEEVAIPSSVIRDEISYTLISIETNAFYDCSFIKSIIIPESVETIAQDVFSGCSGLESIFIPASVTSIEFPTFANCERLNSINVDEANSVYSSINGVLFSKSADSILCYPQGLEGDYVIPTGVITIGDYTFNLCGNLTGITIPKTVEEIGRSAFYGCYGLTTVDIPEGVTSIGYTAFADCRNLNTVNIPKSVTEIDEYAFTGCNHLKIVNSYSAIPPACAATSFSMPSRLPYDYIYLIGTPNEWPAPVESNEEMLTPWRLYRLNEVTNVFMGTFDMPEAPIFRFYTELSGWNGGASIGTQYNDSPIYFQEVPEDYVFEYYVVNGKGSFSFEEVPASKWTIMVDLNDMKVYMTLGDHFPNEIDIQPLTLHVPVGTKEAYATSTGWSKFPLIIDDLEDEPQPTLSHTQVNINPDEVFQLGVNGTTAAPVWSSSDSSIAYVNECGLVVAMGIPGTTIITASIDEYELQCEVNVTLPTRAASSIYPDPEDIIIEGIGGTPLMLNVRLLPVGSSTVMDWSTSDPTVATIEKGLVTILSDGEVSFSVETENGHGKTIEYDTRNDEETGIEEIFGNTDVMPVTVYDLTGRIIYYNATADQIKNLNKGLYIINGKKVLIK